MLRASALPAKPHRLAKVPAHAYDLYMCAIHLPIRRLFCGFPEERYWRSLL
ncbi:hypothetical protein [Desulfovibrio sp.]|uniref:hypothetical protein n=1 Tax=Desulfovibrio sp. TaxID=885 RepID=UPI0025C4700A|nr:hypothetical protein [Desulfovibrio sp.]